MREIEREKEVKSGYSLIVCEKCGTRRYVESKQYRNGLPTTCIACDKK